jgi:ribosomal protein S15P/S13E
MSDEFSKTESMLSIAEDIEELSSHFPQQDRLDVKTALSCIELYKSTFGDEGFTFLDNKVNSLMTKYGYEQPDAIGLQEIKNLTEKLVTLKTHQFNNYQDQKNYNSLIESEKKEISMSEKNEDVWIKAERISWYSESLCHNFNDNKIRFELSKHSISKSDPILVTVIDGFRGVATGDDVLTFSFNGDILAAKKMIENSIKYFKHDQVTNIYHFKDYFNTYPETIKQTSSLAQLQEVYEDFVKNPTAELPEQKEISMSKENNNQIFPDNMTISDDGKRVFVDIVNQIDGRFGWLPIETVKEHFGRNSTTDNAIQKIDEHFEKNATIDPNGTLRVTGLNELNRELNKGKPFIVDIIEFYDTHDRLPTKEEIAKLPKQGEKIDRRSVENINSKENFMSNGQTFRPSIDAGEKNAKEEAFTNALSQRKNIMNALQGGTLSCLPGADGYADTTPAVNLVSGNNYHGANMLYLKDHHKQNGFPTAEYISVDQIEKAAKDNPGLVVKPEEKSVFIHWQEKNEEKYENKSVRLFNVAQTSDPERLKTYFSEKKQEEYQQWLEKKQLDQPGYQPPEPKQKEPGPDIECTSTEPDKYLGQYLAAVSIGSKLKVTPEQAAEFSQKIETLIYEKMENGYSDPFKLSKISNNASQYCKDVVKEVKMAIQKEEYHQKQEQKQEQTQSRGRGM